MNAYIFYTENESCSSVPSIDQCSNGSATSKVTATEPGEVSTEKPLWKSKTQTTSFSPVASTSKTSNDFTNVEKSITESPDFLTEEVSSYTLISNRSPTSLGSKATYEYSFDTPQKSSASLDTHIPRDLSNTSSDSEESEASKEEHSHQQSYQTFSQLACFVSPNQHDSIVIKKAFMEKHPIQFSGEGGKKAPFEPSKLYYRILPNGEKIHRKWLSYSIELNKVYCACCMAFGKTDVSNISFISGHDVSVKHIYKAVDKHENSQSHINAATAAFQCLRGFDIATFMNSNLSKKRLKEIETRRLIVMRIIDIILFLGRQGMSYRGHRSEGANTLDSSENHGNFLQLVLLVANYDPILQNHVQQCIEESKKKTGKG